MALFCKLKSFLCFVRSVLILDLLVDKMMTLLFHASIHGCLVVLPPESGQLASLLLHLALELQQLHLDVHLQGLGLVGGEAREVKVHICKY